VKVSQSWVHEAQHGVFRGVSLVFSLVSAHAIFWFFGVLNGLDPLQPYVTGAASAAFAALGYFLTRGLAHRLMKRQRVRSYVVIGVLYVVVEMVCNYAEAAARFPDMTWISLLHGWQLGAFSVLAPLVLSIVPFFNLSLAYIDVDLMAEKEARLSAIGMMSVPQGSGQGVSSKVPGKPLQPKQQLSGSPGMGATQTQTLMPQLSYPSMPPVVVPGPGASSRGPLAGSFNGVRPQGSV
jgi:hypothetical protein